MIARELIRMNYHFKGQDGSIDGVDTASKEKYTSGDLIAQRDEPYRSHDSTAVDMTGNFTCR
jgi:hypothetical protein